MSSSCEQVRLRLSSQEAGRRLGQALWMMAEAPSSPADLVWAQGLLGRDGEQLLWDALREASCIEEGSGRLPARSLARFMCYLVAGFEEARPEDHGLVWTFPENLLRVPGVAGDGYAKALRDVVFSAEHTLTIASPYLEARGVGLLQDALVTALQRGVSVVLLAHDVADLSSMASGALRSLQSEARRQPGTLAVYTTAPEGVLLHLKSAVADRQRGLVGSANLTSKGLGSNVEVGAWMNAHEAAELCQVVDRVIASGLAKHVFSTR
jgi:hypothetical protein